MNRKLADRIDKRDLFALIEVAHAEGMGARRLAALIGYSRDHIRRSYRALGLSPLDSNSHKAPSVRLVGLLQCVPFLHIARLLENEYAGDGTVRPENTEAA